MAAGSSMQADWRRRGPG